MSGRIPAFMLDCAPPAARTSDTSESEDDALNQGGPLSLNCWRVVVIALALVYGSGVPALAQSADGGRGGSAQGTVSDAPAGRRSEVAVLGGGGRMWPGFHLEADHRFATAMIQVGRTIRDRRGSAFAGTIEAFVELVPVFRMSQSNTATGFGVLPVSFRWNMDPANRVQPFFELASGVLITDKAVPEGTARFNFVAAAGPGLRVWLTERQALMLGYRFHHISNGNRLDLNPGINSNFFFAGLAIRR